ncbi:surfeit locus protein 2 isoform X1 [Gasterosteus aculeatus]
MDELAADLRAFLLNHPFLQLTDSKKIKCTLNGHEMPCSLTELQNFTKGKKYVTLSAAAEFNYSQYEPHVVPSSKQPKQLFCKLTLRHLNRQPHHVLRHVNGKRFKKALCKCQCIAYLHALHFPSPPKETHEECVKQGIEFVPAALKQKRPKGTREDPRERPSNQGSKSWEPSSSDDDQSDSEDSMSDLYPPTMFTLKNQAEDATHCVDNEAEDDFKTDEEEEMEVESQGLQKRKKVQSGGFQKKFRNNNYKNKSGRKKSGKVPNGK